MVLLLRSACPHGHHYHWNMAFGEFLRDSATHFLTICLSPIQCLNILALSVLTVIVRSPAMVHELHNNGRSDMIPDQEVHPALPTPLSKIETQYREHDLNYRKLASEETLTHVLLIISIRHHFSSNIEQMDMSGLMYLCLIAISSMLVYGALKGKRSYLLPFFCLQLFDFAITT